jgi:hypothetical protein
MPDKAAAELLPLVSHEQLENAFWLALRMFVGRGKRHKAAEVSVGAGVHRRTLDCYRGYPVGHYEWRPLDYAQKFSIASFIGADLTSEWIRFLGQEAIDLPDDPDGDLDTAGLDAGEAAHSIQRARHPASPGGVQIVPQERAEIIPILRKSAASARRAVA